MGHLLLKKPLDLWCFSFSETFTEQFCCRSYRNAIPVPGWHSCISDSPKLKNHGSQKFFSKQYIIFQQNVKVLLKKTTLKFEGRWRKICDGPTSSKSNDISSTNKDCWQLDLPKTVRSSCITPNHLHFPNKILLICGNFSVHKRWKKVWILVSATNWREELWVQLNHFSFGKK